LKPLAFILRRCPDPFGQGAGIANINGDANAALAIYDLLTDVDYGLGIAPARIDAANFQAVAVVLAGEGLGISMQFDTQSSADQLMGEILRHVDGVLYTDPSTGLWTIKLARADYDPSTVPTLDVVNVLGTPDFSRSSWTETTNLVHIKFVSRLNNFNDRIVTDYDPANIGVTGEVRSQTIEFKGISQEATAALIATRVLKTLTYPLGKIKIVCNRTAWKFRPSGVFKFTWIPLGITGMVFRVTRVAFGELLDGKITIDAVEDIFGINDTAFAPAPPSGWINPLGAPLAPAAQKLIELPYHFNQTGIFALAICARGDGTSTSYEIWVNDGGGDFLGNAAVGFCPIGLLSAAYPAATPATDATGFTLTLAGQVDLDALESVSAAEMVNGKILALIDQEIVSIQTVTPNSDGSVSFSGIMRGVCDTVPADHASGATVFFISQGTATTKPTPYLTDGTREAKLLPMNAFGEFPITSASYDAVNTRSRAARPYPPGCLQINGNPYGTRPSTIIGDITLTWKSRNRLTQTVAGALVAQDAGDIAGEAGQVFDIYVFAADAVQIRTALGVALETWTYTSAQRLADGHPDPITIQVFSKVGALESYMPNGLTVTMEPDGFGLLFGEGFGG
jgi:hypothetical protein